MLAASSELVVSIQEALANAKAADMLMSVSAVAGSRKHSSNQNDLRDGKFNLAFSLIFHDF